MDKENKKEEKKVIEEVVDVIEQNQDATTQPNQISETEAKELQERVSATSEKIQAILTEDKMALQPILHTTQFGIRPDVALVPLPEPEELPGNPSAPKVPVEPTSPTPITDEDVAELVNENDKVTVKA